MQLLIGHLEPPVSNQQKIVGLHCLQRTADYGSMPVTSSERVYLSLNQVPARRTPFRFIGSCPMQIGQVHIPRSLAGQKMKFYDLERSTEHAC